ncbi:methyl-accepting chemotaxis protein [Marinobacter sp. X15-166B]|uniref:methyl-accepting chemotaxis protein n=1 Tax=Marinobacter sp. X15-166B TaxID=1897620 RepID=UPI00085CB0B4|nr:methyl-accepting chemotaxis protein [Marinobacter sp. X15-166B]OEY66261.1 ATP-binding protein [Marinobacter sp. X15-166B]
MSVLSQLSIRMRLLLAILVPVTLTALVGAAVSVNEIRSNGDAELQRLHETLLGARQEGLKNVVETARSVVEAVSQDPSLSDAEARQEALRRIRAIDFGDNNYVFAYERDFRTLALRTNPASEGSIVTNPKVQNLIRDLFSVARSGEPLAYEWANLASGGKVEPKIAYSAIIDKWDWMLGAGVYTTDIDAVVAEAAANIDRQIASTLGVILMATLVVVVASLVVGSLVIRTVTRPLNRVTGLMREIAEGDGDLRQRLPDRGSDELAELGRRFNAFVGKIQHAMQEVGTTTHQLASAAEELSSVAVETSQSVQEQGSQTDQIASAINEMAATIQQIAGNANSVESAASDADRLAREGGETIGNAQTAVNQLSAEIEQSAQSIASLAERSDSIQQVLDVIHSVTDQTNLLALNAAIEAARAGEHGRGFSVVADEVRQLAHRSAESADQIREMIDGFVTESRTAVARMEAAQQHSGATVERIDHATGALTTIETSVGHIHEQVTQIAAAAEQQGQVAEEINQHIVGIVDAAQRSDAGVSQTTAASQELARLGESLRSLVGQFKV